MFNSLLRITPAPLRRPSLLHWLLDRLHHWKDRRHLARMEARLREDAGLPPHAPSHPDWDPPEWWNRLL